MHPCMHPWSMVHGLDPTYYELRYLDEEIMDASMNVSMVHGPWSMV